MVMVMMMVLPAATLNDNCFNYFHSHNNRYIFALAACQVPFVCKTCIIFNHNLVIVGGLVDGEMQGAVVLPVILKIFIENPVHL